MKKHKKCHHTKSLDELIIKDILSYPQAMCGVDKGMNSLRKRYRNVFYCKHFSSQIIEIYQLLQRHLWKDSMK